MAIITTRSKEKNSYKVYYDETTETIFKDMNYIFDLELVYKKYHQRRYGVNQKINFYLVATFLYNYKN